MDTLVAIVASIAGIVLVILVIFVFSWAAIAIVGTFIEWVRFLPRDLRIARGHREGYVFKWGGYVTGSEDYVSGWVSRDTHDTAAEGGATTYMDREGRIQTAHIREWSKKIRARRR